MPAQNYDTLVTYIATEAIDSGVRVKLLSTGKVAIAAAAEVSIGSAIAPVAANEAATIRTKFGTRQALVNGTTAIAVGDSLEAAAAGALVKASAGTVVAVAMGAATTNGAKIEVVGV